MLLWAYHIHIRVLLPLIERPRFSFFITGDKWFLPCTKADRFSITKKIHLKITRYQLINEDKLDINGILKVEYEGFIHIGKITFKAAQLAAPSFNDIKVTRIDIFFSKFYQFVMLRLKSDKTDINYIRVFTVIGVGNEPHCPLMTLSELIFRDFHLADIPYFSLAKEALSRKILINILKTSLAKCTINASNYSGHIFRLDKK